MKPALRLVSEPTPAEIAEQIAAARKEARDGLLERIAGHVPEREDERRHPRGHVWTRNPQHEAMVLKIIASRPEQVRTAMEMEG